MTASQLLEMLEEMLEHIGDGAMATIERHLNDDGDVEFDLALYGDWQKKDAEAETIAHESIAAGISDLYEITRDD